MCCRLCPLARSNQLVPCCWCESWVHWRCSYTVRSGRACASHFNVLNPLDKVVVTRTDDDTVPSDHKGLQLVPNTFYPKASKSTLKPSDLMIGFETYWAYKHAWRGAGYYYRKGDHVPQTKGGHISLANALSLVAAWETWYHLPRPQPVDPVLITSHGCLGNWMLIILMVLGNQCSHPTVQYPFQWEAEKQTLLVTCLQAKELCGNCSMTR